MPTGTSVIDVDRIIVPDVVKITPNEVKRLIPMLEALKRGDLGQVDISDGAQTLSILKDRRDQMLSKLTLTVADTTLSQSFTIRVAGHTLTHFLNSLRRWGNDVASFTFDVNNVPGLTPTIRFLLAPGS